LHRNSPPAHVSAKVKKGLFSGKAEFLPGRASLQTLRFGDPLLIGIVPKVDMIQKLLHVCAAWMNESSITMCRSRLQCQRRGIRQRLECVQTAIFSKWHGMSDSEIKSNA
jgi:hypothetical protein